MPDETTQPDSTPDDPQRKQRERDTLEKQCDDEYARYLPEREQLKKSELDAEKNYDTLLVSLSTLAIGSSFTVLKDIVQHASAIALIVLAWIALGICLLSALVDRLLTYYGHKEYRRLLDKEFTGTWSGPGAFDRAYAAYKKIWWRKPLPYMKWFGFVFLSVGLILLMVFIFIAMGAKSSDEKPSVPVVVNVYNSATPVAKP